MTKYVFKVKKPTNGIEREQSLSLEGSENIKFYWRTEDRFGEIVDSYYVNMGRNQIKFNLTKQEEVIKQPQSSS